MAITKHPIETAPKDGTRVLLFGGTYFDDVSGPDAKLGHYPYEFRAPVIARWVELDDRDPDGFWLIVKTEYDKVEYYEPTHWASLSDL